ncbi:MAG: DUF4184 family protein [Mycobacteriales bacterium]
MPFTFVSHQGAVLPLRLQRRLRVDGVALAVGASAPDLTFPLAGTPWYIHAHQPLAQFWWCLPVTLVLGWLIRRVVAAPVAAHLPGAGLRDYASLAVHRHPWWVSVCSALAGTWSHVIWDNATHRWGWFVARVGWLRSWVEHGGYLSPQVLSSVAGAAVSVAVLVRLARTRALYDPAAPRFPVTAGTTAALCAWTLGLWTAGTAFGMFWYARHGLITSLVLDSAAGLFAGALAGSLHARRLAAAPAVEMSDATRR